MNSSSPKIRVLIVDDHPSMRHGLRQYIDSENDMAAVGEASNGAEAVDEFLRLKPDVTLMDLQMPKVDGLHAISAIRSHVPDAVIVVMTTYPGDARAARALALGAKSYLLKSADAEVMLAAIRGAVEGRAIIAPEIVSELKTYRYAQQLTAREREVLQLIAAGNTNRDIAGLLQVSEHTIKTHVKNLLAKLGGHDRAHAIALATRRGFIGP